MESVFEAATASQHSRPKRRAKPHRALLSCNLLGYTARVTRRCRAASSVRRNREFTENTMCFGRRGSRDPLFVAGESLPLGPPAGLVWDLGVLRGKIGLRHPGTISRCDPTLVRREWGLARQPQPQPLLAERRLVLGAGLEPARLTARASKTRMSAIPSPERGCRTFRWGHSPAQERIRGVVCGGASPTPRLSAVPCCRGLRAPHKREVSRPPLAVVPASWHPTRLVVPASSDCGSV